MSFKLLHIDIETAPMVVYTFSLHQPYLGPEHVIKSSRLLCFAAKWHGEKEMIFHCEWRGGHRAMVRAAHKLLDEADGISHFNGLSFDTPILNREFITHGLPPPSPAYQIDLYQTVKHRFRMDSSKLAFVGPFLKIGEKIKHQGFDLWRGCEEHDPECLALMEKYNREDTALTERLYTAILPWIQRHPNINMYNEDGCDKPRCTICGSEKIQWRGYARGECYTYQRYQCIACGKWGQGRQSVRAIPKPTVKGL